jgi:glycosyltransferase involved in cell wall biosynthesis
MNKDILNRIRRHKNINALLDSFEQFNRKAPGIWLVMVGRHGQRIELNRKNVLYLGEVASDADLAGIYNQACCLFNLSLYEGFGLTILEAQKCGLPIVCSDIPPHREIGGEGIAAVNVSYIDQIDEVLYKIVFNNDLRNMLISKGAENTARFDWHSTAKNTIELYQKVVNEGSNSSRLAAGHAGRGKDT